MKKKKKFNTKILTEKNIVSEIKKNREIIDKLNSINRVLTAFRTMILYQQGKEYDENVLAEIKDIEKNIHKLNLSEIEVDLRYKINNLYKECSIKSRLSPSTSYRGIKSVKEKQINNSASKNNRKSNNHEN